MHDLLRIWRRIEALPVTAGIDQQWRVLLGDDIRLLEPYLMPEQQLATSYPCPDPIYDNCPRRVVQNGTDDIVAVCGNTPPQCEPVTLTRRDLLIRSLNTEKWIAAVTKCLREVNGLDVIELDVPDGVVVLGTLNRRGRRLAVVWVRREIADIENLVRGIRATTGAADLIAVLPPDCRGQTDRPLAGGVVLLTFYKGDDGRLDLYRALDLLDPTYRQRRIDDPSAIFDDVRLEFGEEPGVRHVVRINGQEYDGFQKSDIKFARLLLLAAARARDADVENGGWINKTQLRGGEDRDRDLEKLRKEFHDHSHPGLTNDELKALIKSKKRTGEIRLAVPPMNIKFDDSLRQFEFIGASRARSKQPNKLRTFGMKELDRNLAEGAANARLVLKDARKLGVPSPDLLKRRGE